MTSRRKPSCFLGFHSYGPWVKTGFGSTMVDMVIVKNWKILTKTCVRCGKKKKRKRTC